MQIASSFFYPLGLAEFVAGFMLLNNSLNYGFKDLIVVASSLLLSRFKVFPSSSFNLSLNTLNF